MTEAQYTHQVQIFASSSVSLREVEQDFPFRHDEGIVAQRPQHTCIFMVGDLNDEQVKWLTTQKGIGKIKGWQVDPIRSVPTQGSRQPSEKTRDDSNPSGVTNIHWLYAHRQQGSYPEATEEGSGKWMVFVPREQIDNVWLIIAEAIRQGKLGNSAKVSTARPNPNSTNQNDHVICVYTYDYRDLEDVKRIRSTLRELGITWKIPYKTDAATYAGQYQVRGHRRISTYYE